MLPCVRTAWRASLPHRCPAAPWPHAWPAHLLSHQPCLHPLPSLPHQRASSSSHHATLETAAAAEAAEPSARLPEVTDDASSSIGAGDDWQQRTRLLVGEAGIAALASTRVLLVGLGGVGSFAGEFLARAGIGELTIVDGDVVDTTNRNRQLPALTSTIGHSKAALMEARLLDINPALRLTVRHEFLHPDTSEHLVAGAPYDFVLDCIDSIAPKVHLIAAAHARGIRVVSSMGAGGRRDPSAVQVADISETYNDRFAAEVRRSLRKRHGVRSGVAVVFSSELAAKASMSLVDGNRYKKSYYGTISYIPALFGLNMAAHVVNSVLESVGQPAPKTSTHTSGHSAPKGVKASKKGRGNSSKTKAAAGKNDSSSISSSSSSSSSEGNAALSKNGGGSRQGGDPEMLRFDDVKGVGVGYDGSCI